MKQKSDPKANCVSMTWDWTMEPRIHTTHSDELRGVEYIYSHEELKIKRIAAKKLQPVDEIFDVPKSVINFYIIYFIN